jgi:low density lipoprotein-related protein 2
VDCPDGSDETVERCSEVQFACEDGSLVLHAKRCDGTVDCSTGEDEACEEAAFRCNDGQFIGGKQRCDGDADCFDGSDELDC